MKYTILILRDARRDHAKIVDYIARRSSRGATAWANAFERAIRNLEKHAHACPLAAEIDDLDFEARETLFKTRRVPHLVYHSGGRERSDRAPNSRPGAGLRSFNGYSRTGMKN